MDPEGPGESYAVILAPKALEDLADAVAYISVDDPVAAERFGQALIDKTHLLAGFPELGRELRGLESEVQARELIHRSYRIVYRVDHHRRRVEVARFWHAARGYPEI